ncbi:hypothetical protein P8C59_009437 [Phyllachora maydis]|uniref:Uncharacterized protein n=1 Tax=Phyllachora maydis TaxID=1825666 RepID=A0AAD9MFM0_9PEZI|nr:hypothetical protein P8C59_009437 [Phyllachora maydis]
MSQPRAKRRYAGDASALAQRPITSFFSPQPPQPAGDPALLGRDAAAAAAAFPAPPPSVQADLLSVGMRVRKSVPEGYKTGSAYGGFALWSDAAPPAPAPAPASTPRELLPFCGLLRTGGLAVQPSTLAPRPVCAVPGLDDLPGLSSSQDSVASAASAVPGPTAVRAGQKRRGGDDDDADVPAREVWLGGEGGRVPAGWENARLVAVPRRTKGLLPNTVAAAAAAAVDFGQENMAVDDFGEAPFLDTRLHGGEDVDGEDIVLA